jgi:16S rRNA (adenine1518-N6/adenine1519-N6)-dimethyltransferase
MPDDYPRVKRLVEGAFAHRRKTLANSLELSGVISREEAVRALAAIGRAPATRAEALAPDDFVRLAQALA